MTVRKGDPPVYQEVVVHAELTQHIADLIARIKMGGGAGVKSELNFCLYCRARLSSLSVPAGYVRQGAYTSNPLCISDTRPQIFTFATRRRNLITSIFGSHCPQPNSGRHFSISQVTVSRCSIKSPGGTHQLHLRWMLCIYSTLVR
jgi:hypothetical protein